MGDLGWVIVLNLLGLAGLITWTAVGLQFHQITGERVVVSRGRLILWGTLTLMAEASVDLTFAFFPALQGQIIRDIPLFTVIIAAVAIAGRWLYRRTPAQILRAVLMFLCLIGTVALFQILFARPAVSLTGEVRWQSVIIQLITILFVVLSGGVLRKLFSYSAGGGGKIPWRTIPQCAALLVFAAVLLSVQDYILIYIRGGLLLYALGWLALLVTGFLTVDLYGIQERHALATRELEVYKKQSAMQYAYYRELEEKYDRSRKLIHDIRNHLHAIEGLYSRGETGAAGDYTAKIHDSLNRLGQKYYCDNRMLNIILADKVESAGRQGIRVTLRVGEARLDWMDDVDITTIFANLLDNAIHAAASVANDPWISVSLREVRDFLVVEIKNSAVPKNSYEAERRRRAGIGLKNVRYTVEQYDGTLETVQDAETFAVSVVIPLGGGAS